jgi:hypothetical protein
VQFWEFFLGWLGSLEWLILLVLFNGGGKKEGVCGWFFGGEFVVICVVSAGF